MLSHIRKHWSLYAAVACFLTGIFFLFSGHAQAAQPTAPIVKTQAGVPTDAISVDTGGYGVIGTDAKDAATCADKSSCILLTERAAMLISHQVEKAEALAAQYKAQLDAIKAAKAGSKCI